MTTYIVLSLRGPVATFVAVDVEAHSADSAIRAYVDGAAKADAELDVSGQYVAVPSRSWKPTTVAVETQTVIRLDGGSI